MGGTVVRRMRRIVRRSVVAGVMSGMIVRMPALGTYVFRGVVILVAGGIMSMIRRAVTIPVLFGKVVPVVAAVVPIPTGVMVASASVAQAAVVSVALRIMVARASVVAVASAVIPILIQPAMQTVVLVFPAAAVPIASVPIASVPVRIVTISKAVVTIAGVTA